jgi:hypothetical protein
MSEEISPLENHGWWMEQLRKDAKANRPEALRLAERLERRRLTRWVHATGETPRASGYVVDQDCAEAAAELRRLHAVESKYNELLFAVERYLCFSKPLDNDPVQPLYTHPPRMEWQSLTEEERANIPLTAVERRRVRRTWNVPAPSSRR